MQRVVFTTFLPVNPLHTSTVYSMQMPLLSLHVQSPQGPRSHYTNQRRVQNETFTLAFSCSLARRPPRQHHTFTCPVQGAFCESSKWHRLIACVSATGKYLTWTCSTRQPVATQTAGTSTSSPFLAPVCRYSLHFHLIGTLHLHLSDMEGAHIISTMHTMHTLAAAAVAAVMPNTFTFMCRLATKTLTSLPRPSLPTPAALPTLHPVSCTIKRFPAP